MTTSRTAFNKYKAWHVPGAKCPTCKLERTDEGHDPCIANLPGVAFACCGHGFQMGYVCFDNGVVLRATSRRAMGWGS